MTHESLQDIARKGVAAAVDNNLPGRAYLAVRAQDESLLITLEDYFDLEDTPVSRYIARQIAELRTRVIG